MAAKYSNTYTINANIAQVCAIIRDPFFQSSQGLSFKSENPVQNGTFFSFKKGVTFSSWGENVDISVLYQTDNSVQLIIKSECSLPTQIIDWGKNKENVEKFYNQLLSSLSSNQNAPVQQAPTFTPAQQVPTFTPAQQAPVATFCIHCGTKLNPDSRFCHGCGKPVV